MGLDLDVNGLDRRPQCLGNDLPTVDPPPGVGGAEPDPGVGAVLLQADQGLEVGWGLVHAAQPRTLAQAMSADGGRLRAA